MSDFIQNYKIFSNQNNPLRKFALMQMLCEEKRYGLPYIQK